MISEKEMKSSERKKIRLLYIDGEVIETFCEEYIQAEDENEEPMLFLPNKLVALQSEIKSIEILD